MLCSAGLRRPLALADPELSFMKPLLAEQREYQPDPGAGVDSAVCEALMALQAGNEAAKAAAATPHAADKFVLLAADELGFAPSPTAVVTMLWATRASAVGMQRVAAAASAAAPCIGVPMRRLEPLYAGPLPDLYRRRRSPPAPQIDTSQYMSANSAAPCIGVPMRRPEPLQHRPLPDLKRRRLSPPAPQIDTSKYLSALPLPSSTHLLTYCSSDDSGPVSWNTATPVPPPKTRAVPPVEPPAPPLLPADHAQMFDEPISLGAALPELHRRRRSPPAAQIDTSKFLSALTPPASAHLLTYRASALLKAAAAHRTFVEHCLITSHADVEPWATSEPRLHLSAHNQTGYKGVQPYGQRFSAATQFNGSTQSLGLFATARGAAVAYARAADGHERTYTSRGVAFATGPHPPSRGAASAQPRRRHPPECDRLQQQLAEMMDQQMTGEEAIEVAISLGMPDPRPSTARGPWDRLEDAPPLQIG